MPRLPWYERVLGDQPRALAVLDEMGLEPGDLTERDRRLPCEVAMRGIARAVEVFDDPTLGLQAGAHSDEGMFDVVEQAARATNDLGSAIELITRYFRVMTESAEIWVERKDGLASWCYAPVIAHPPAANDMVVAASLGDAFASSSPASSRAAPCAWQTSPVSSA